MDNQQAQENKQSENIVKQEFFRYRMEVEMQRADRMSSAFSIAVLHLDTPKIRGVIYPKSVLDNRIGDTISHTLRTLDIASKDERNDFILLLTEANSTTALLVMQRLYSSLGFLNASDVQTNYSIGISSYPEDAKTVDELISGAKYAAFLAHQDPTKKILSTTHIKKGVNWEEQAQQAFKSTKKKFESIIESTIKSLLTMYGTRYSYLENHSLQVAKFSSLFAESLGLKDEYVREVTLAALLHDVGYLELPPHILNKPGALTHEERLYIEKHPILATDKILKPIKSLENVLPIIKDHHERWDGLGYPYHKSMREIHIGARILSIADAYESMISERPYRDAFQQEEVIKRLKLGAGTHWEEKLIQAFIELLSNQQSSQQLLDRRT